MAMVKPVINWDNFFADVDAGMSAYNLQNKYALTPRQYRWIMRRIIRKDGYSRKATGIKKNEVQKDFNDCYISVQKGKTGFIVRKNNVYYGTYETLDLARKIKKALTKVDWDKSKLNKIRKDLGLKPMRYSYAGTVKTE